MARRQLEFPDLGRLSGNAARHRAGTARRTPAGRRLGLDVPVPGGADLRAGACRVGILPRRRPAAERSGTRADVRRQRRGGSSGGLGSRPGGAGLGSGGRRQMYVSPLSERILDWFHITMKLTVINQMRKSLVGAEPAAWLGEGEKNLESLKWHLWNGNVDQALRLIDGLKAILDGEQISSDRQKLLRTIREFGNYIAANQA